MAPAQKIQTPDGKPMLSARKAALRLRCAPDYIGKLCREGKLRGQLIDKAWFVETDSLNEFEAARQATRAARAEELSRERKEELTQHGFVPKPATVASPVAATVATTGAFAYALKVAIACAAAGALVASSAVVTHSLEPQSQTAAIAQIDSPFFGASAPTSTTSVIGTFFASLFTPKIQPQVAVVSQQNTTPVATTSAPVQQTIVQNTYPVIQRTIEHTVTVADPNAVSTSDLATRLQEVENSLTAKIYAISSQVSGNQVIQYAPAQRIDKLNGVTITNSTIDGYVTSGSTIAVANGGTGLTSYTAGDLLYATGSGTLAKLPIGTAGQVLKVSGGLPVWGTNTGGSGGGTWATTTDNLAQYPTDPTQVVLIGATATTTRGNIFEVTGNSLFNGGIVATRATTTNATSTNLYASQLTLGSALAIGSGGTGTSTAPAYGQVLVGNSAGGYDLLSTSSLGIVSGGSSFPFVPTTNYGAAANSTSTPIWFQAGLEASSTSHFANLDFLLATGTSATTTNFFATTASSTNLFAQAATVGTLDGAGLTACNNSTQKLLWANGTFSCGTDQTGGGAGTDVNWTYFNGSGLYVATSTNQVLIGAASTSTLSKLEVHGGATIDNSTTTSATSTNSFATTASSTNLFAQAAQVGSLTISNLSGFLKATAGAISTAAVNLAGDVTGILPVANGGTGWSNISANTLLTGNGAGALATTTVGAGLSLSGSTLSNSGVLSIAQSSGSAQTGAITLATTTAAFNGLTLGTAITNTSGTFTFVPTISGTLNNSGLSNSTIALADSNSTLTIGGSPISLGGSGSITLNLSHGNVWTAASTTFAGGLTALTATTTSATSTNFFATALSASALNVSGLSTFANVLVTGSTTLQNFTAINSTTTNATTTGGAYFASSVGIGALPDSQYALNVAAGSQYSINTSGDINLPTTNVVRFGGIYTLSNDTGNKVTRISAGSDSTAAIRFTLGSSEYARLNSTGFGIGSTTPYAKLSVSGFGSGTPGIVADALSGFTGNLLDLKVASSTKLSVNQAGDTTIFGSTTLQNFTALNSTSTNATTTNFFATTASSTNLFAAAAQLGTLTVANTLNAGLSTLAGFISTASSTVNGNLTITGNSTSTNATTTSFFATTASSTNLFATAGTVGSLSGAGLSTCNTTTDKLLWNGGTFSCGTDAGSVGTTEINWTYFNNSGIRVGTTTNQVLIGATATTTKGSLEVAGGSIEHYASGNPLLAGSVTSGNLVYQTAIAGRYAYSVEFGGGLRILDISNPKSPTVAGTYSGIANALSVAVSGKYAYVGDSATGLNILDVSSPSTTVKVGGYSFPEINASMGMYGIAVSGRYVYVTDYDHGSVYTVDVTDPTAPKWVGKYAITGGAPYALAVQGKYLYVGDQGTARVYVVDVSNPGAPTTVGSYTASGIIPSSLYVSGKYLYVGDQSKGMYILDISKPTNILLAGQYKPDVSDAYYGVSVAGNYAYVADHTNKAALVLDVSNPASPALVGSYSIGSGAPMHVSLYGKYAYVANYNGGIQIVDINGLNTPAATVGSLAATQANVSDSLAVGGDITAGGGLNIGIGGILSRGTIAAAIASTTQGYTSSSTPTVASFIGGNVGIGTTSPYALLTLHAAAGQVVPTLFSISSSTAAFATSTLFTVDNKGLVTAINLLLTGSTTLQNFTALNSTTTNATTTNFYTSGSFFAAASSTIGNGTGTGGLTINGNATTTGMLRITNDPTLATDRMSQTQLSLSSTLNANTSGQAILGSEADWYTTGSGNFNITGQRLWLGSGFSGSALTRTLDIYNMADGGQHLGLLDTLGNIGATIQAQGGAATNGNVGDNVGVYAIANGSGHVNVGLYGRSNDQCSGTCPTSTADIGVVGLAGTISHVSSNIGGIFVAGGGSNWYTTLGSTSAAAILDNSGFTSIPLLVGDINGTSTFTISGTGGIISTSTTNSTNFWQVLNSSGGPVFNIDTANTRVGIGTTSPWAQLSVNTVAGSPAFAIGSSTGTQFIVDKSGNVGIGTTTLVNGLAITSNLGAANILLQGGPVNGNANLTINSNDGHGYTWQKVNASNLLRLYTDNGTQSTFDVRGQLQLGGGVVGASATLDVRGVSSAGNALINTSTSTPYATLAVSSQSGSTTVALIPKTSQTNNILDVYSATGALADVITATGNIGIGTTTPSGALAVNGTSFLGGNLIVTGNSTTTNATTTTSFATTASSTNLFAQVAQLGSLTLSSVLGIASGGTNAGSQTTNGVNYYDGSKITSGSVLTFDGTTLGTNKLTASGLASLGSASTSLLSVTGTAYFGGSSTTTIDSLGNVNISQFAALQQGGVSILYASSTTHSIQLGANAGNTTNVNAAYNTLIGHNAGTNITSGANNLILGAWSTAANANITSGSNNIVLGYNIKAPSATNNNQLDIGNIIYGTAVDGAAATVSSGQVGIGSTTPNARLAIHLNAGDTNTNAFTIGSSTAAFATSTLFNIDNTGLVTAKNLTVTSSTTLQNVTTLNSTSTNATTTTSFATTASSTNLFSQSAAVGGLILNGANGALSASNGTVSAGTLSVGNGGTGATSFTAGSLIFSNGTTLAQDNAALFYDNTNHRLGIGTTTPWASLSINAGSASTTFAIGSSTSTYFVVNSAGNVGIGTSTPWTKLGLTNGVTSGQVDIAFDNADHTTLSTNATGQYIVVPSGNSEILPNANLWVCTGGTVSTNACPTGAPSGQGNLVVANRLGIGTTTLGVSNANYKLAIETQDSTSNFINIASSTSNWSQTTSIFTIGANGRVGIGTSTPFLKLSVGAGGAITTVENNNGSVSSSLTVDWSQGNQQRVTLTGNPTISFSNYVAGQILRLVVCQDSTGARTVTWSGPVIWQGAAAPTLTTTANYCDLVAFVATYATSTNLVIMGSAALNFP